MSNKFRIKDSDGNEFDVEPLPPDNISGCFVTFAGIAVVLIVVVFIYLIIKSLLYIAIGVALWGMFSFLLKKSWERSKIKKGEDADYCNIVAAAFLLFPLAFGSPFLFVGTYMDWEELYPWIYEVFDFFSNYYGAEGFIRFGLIAIPIALTIAFSLIFHIGIMKVSKA